MGLSSGIIDPSPIDIGTDDAATLDAMKQALTAGRPQQVDQQQAPITGELQQPAPTSSAAPQPQAAQPQGPPSPGGKPLLLDYIQNMIKGGSQGGPSRGDSTLNFMGSFLQNLAQGLAQAGHGPGANLRGFAGGVQAPYQRQLQQYQLGQQQQAQQSQIASEAARTQQTIAQTEQMKSIVQTPYGPMSEKLAEKVFPAEVRGQATTEAATTRAGATVDAAKINQGVTVDVPKELQDQFGVGAKLPVKALNALETAAGKPLTMVQGANDTFQVNKLTGAKTPLGVGNSRIAARLAAPVQVADPNTPGGVKFMTAGEALRTGAQSASSANVTVPKAVLKDFTSGKSAQSLNSFNTASEHLNLLSKLGDALQNGDLPSVNRLGNSFATATGGAAPTSFNMAKNAVAGEVAKVFKGVATEGEIKSISDTVNNSQSPAQLKGAIDTAQKLMDSKRGALMEQYDQGIKSHPAFPGPKGGAKSYSPGNPFAPKK